MWVHHDIGFWMSSVERVQTTNTEGRRYLRKLLKNMQYRGYHIVRLPTWEIAARDFFLENLLDGGMTVGVATSILWLCEWNWRLS